MSANRHIHTTDPVYAPPVIRAPSPTGSLSTEYGPDETSDNELTDEQFARKCEERIRFSKEAPRGSAGGYDPDFSKILIPKPNNKHEETVLFTAVMNHLRRKVRAVEEEELFEANILQSFSPAFEEQPSSHDIDTIMRSMLGPPSSAGQSKGKEPMQGSPNMTQSSFVSHFGGL